jgi:hypothetical protein
MEVEAMKLSAILMLGALLLATAWAFAATDLPNASFEEGNGAQPVGWKGSGTVAWGDGGGADGRRFISLGTGLPGGDAAGSWESDPVALQPGATYELRMECRCRSEKPGASPFAVLGMGFVHREFLMPTDKPLSAWQTLSVRFVAPSTPDAARSPVRLAQWMLNGWLDFDDVQLLPVKLAHRSVEGLMLGDGESVSGNTYRFSTAHGRHGNVSRALGGYGAYFHHDRWRLNGDAAFITYRHELARRRILDAKASISIWWTDKTSLKVRVEASRDGAAWVPVGLLGDGESGVCQVPEVLLPTEALYIRLSKDATDASKPGLFQITGYTLEAKVDGPPIEATGGTSAVTVLGEDEGLAVDPLPLAPGENAFAVLVRNNGAGAVRLHPALSVSRDGASPAVTQGPAAELAPGERMELRLPYGSVRAGQYAVELRLADGLQTVLTATDEVSILDDSSYGESLPSPDATVGLWWASSGWKVSRTRPLPEARGEALRLALAGNESEACQLILRPERPLSGLTATAGELRTDEGVTLPPSAAEVLRVHYVHVAQASDGLGRVGEWPDPLPPFRGGVSVPAGGNQPLWISVRAPRDAKPGLYRGKVSLTADGFRAEVPLEVRVYGFSLPDETTCRSLFGLGCWGPGRLLAYHRTETDADRRQVYDQYLHSFAEHRISPYNPAALDAFDYQWNTGSPWDGGRIATDEVHAGRQALKIEDAGTTANAEARHREPLAFSGKSVRLSLWYRTAKAEESAELILCYLDRNKAHIAYRNQHIGLPGTTEWTRFERVTEPPAGAAYLQPVLEGAPWTQDGAKTGTAWMDELSLVDTDTGAELLADGGLETARPVGADTQVTFDCPGWDAAMERAMKEYHFNSFVFGVPGLGGGTFYSRVEGELLGFQQGSPEYRALFRAWCEGARAHLVERGLLDKAVTYPFDEPGEKDYPFVVNQLRLLKENFPGLRRMVPMNLGAADAFVGYVDMWCPILSSHNPEFAAACQQAGDLYTWYICCGPKEPYIANFIDRPATDLRVWLWQTWQHKVDGVLIWDSVWWTSGAAYPDSLQNPYEDTMSWVDGYGTPRGEKRAWNAGDGRFLYPPEACFDEGDGPVLEPPVTTIRWEALRDGMEDFEYLAMLKRLLAANRGELSAKRTKTYERLLSVPEGISRTLTSYTREPAPIETRRDEIARAIEELSLR